MELTSRNWPHRISSWTGCLIWLGLLLSCKTPVPNVPICAELTPTKAGCVKTITGERFYIDDTKLFEGKTYWQMKPEMLLVPASSWVEMKKFILKICHKTKSCQAEVSSWQKTMVTIDDQLKFSKFDDTN